MDRIIPYLLAVIFVLIYTIVGIVNVLYFFRVIKKKQNKKHLRLVK